MQVKKHARYTWLNDKHVINALKKNDFHLTSCSTFLLTKIALLKGLIIVN